MDRQVALRRWTLRAAEEKFEHFWLLFFSSRNKTTEVTPRSVNFFIIIINIISL